MMPRPVFILIRCNKPGGAHFHRILLLSTTPADCHDLVTPHPLRKHQAVMAQSANPHNPNLLPRPGPAPFTCNGEKAVTPPQSIGAAMSLGSASGILKTKWLGPRQ